MAEWLCGKDYKTACKIAEGKLEIKSVCNNFNNPCIVCGEIAEHLVPIDTKHFIKRIILNDNEKRNAGVQIYYRDCVKDFVLEAKNGDRLELIKGEEYLTSRIYEDDMVTVFTRYWVKVPADLFVGERERPR